MRLLIITHDYPPIATPRAYRWEALAGQLARSGHAVDVICAWGPGAARVERRNGVRVHRVGGMLLGRLRHGFHD
ncbi:MAG TPA: hypothetical protein VML55_13155, partial [Planctomycetaceae bacterium]|nr:hypothetical protein [Planctomycetaceae bacterium]